MRLTIACFSRGEGEGAVGGVSPAVLQLMVGCAQGGVSGSLQEVLGNNSHVQGKVIMEPERMNR